MRRLKNLSLFLCVPLLVGCGDSDSDAQNGNPMPDGGVDAASDVD